MSHPLISVPLSGLKSSKPNMRKTDKLADIDQLAASIEANGLLENLIVHKNGDGASYEVRAKYSG
jgi:ParB family chromosome partitioning protein